VLARAMAAGFAKGFGNVFSQQAVPVLSTGTSTGTSPFNQVLSPEALQSGVISGAGDALDRLANFYISMAEEMFPVIEVDAGRSVEFILNHGVDLKLRSS